MEILLLQNESSFEIRSVLSAVMLMDKPPRVIRPGITSLHTHSEQLRGGVAMPVGSVEFVREAFAVAGVKEPANLSYPKPMQRYLRRSVAEVRAGSVLGIWFVKPVKTKAFTGFVFNTLQHPSSLSPHDREQYEAFMAMPPGEMVWISEPVAFQSEWRYYVRNRQIVGRGRYDADGEDGAPIPDDGVVSEVCAALPFEHPCAVDIGVLTDGSTALVEVNDAWAIGLYGDALTPSEYLSYLSERWRTLISPLA